MNVYLVVARGPKAGTPIRLKVDRFVMGSGEGCQLRARLAGVAPRHCELIIRNRQVSIRALAEAATILNHDAVPAGAERPVQPGDRLTVGPLEFLVQFREHRPAAREADDWARRALDADARQAGKELEDSDDLLPRATSAVTASAAAAAILDRLNLRRGIRHGRLRVAEVDDIIILRLTDPDLVEAPAITQVAHDLAAAVNRPNARVLLDFKSVRRMSTKAAEMVLEFHHAVRARGGSLAVCRVRSEIRGLFHALRLFQVIPHYHAKDEALAARW